MIFIISIIILSAVEFVGDSSLKEYARDSRKVNKLIIGIVAYIVVVKLLIEALKKSNVLFTNIMWDGISALIESLLAIIILHESLSNAYQWMGLILIIAGIVFLNIGKIPT